MIPHEAGRQFEEIIAHEMLEMDRALAAVSAAAHSKFIAHGRGISGAAMHALVQEAANSLKSRAQFILGQLLRCLAAHRVTLAGETLDEAAALLGAAIETQAQMVRGRLLQNAVFARPELRMARRELEEEYDREAPRLIRRLTNELQLAAAASIPLAAGPDAPGHLVFNGPVGLVQTGDGSRATVLQHIDAGVKAQIAAALAGLTAELEKPENATLGNRRELLELAADAKAEAEKPEPNALKLGASLRAVAETTKFVGSLGPAYQVLKPFLSYFGIHLP
jgi:acyl dehydratase